MTQKDYTGEWGEEANRLLVATARAAGLPEPEGVLAEPRRLVPALDGLLATIPLEEISDDEFWNLNAQLMALVAQVLIVERSAQWVPGGKISEFSDDYVVEVSTGDRISRIDPAVLVRQVLEGPNASATALISLAESRIDNSVS